MSYQVLARKWRPRIFREMVGQEHVLKALINALDHKRLHHAYLFTGTRGVGKTTIARILAKCLNCETSISSEPCGSCSACREIAEGRFVDLIEVDAASRTKVEDTRELLDNVQYSPARGRYKIYLIDEVHMLSNHSFNALLKTLEEPPEHVKFLLATTDPQKLPVTILSRCLQFNLKNMSPERIVKHLQYVLGEELIPYDEAALWLLARSADGSMRDALSLTDQAVAFGNGSVRETDVASMLGSIDHVLIEEIVQALIRQDGQAILAAVAKFADHAPDYDNALAELLTIFHRIAIAQALPEALDNSYGDREQILHFASQLAAEDVQLFYQMAILGRKDLPLAADPRSGFEMTLLRMLVFKPQGVVDIPTQTLPAAALPQEPGGGDSGKKPSAESAPGAQGSATDLARPTEAVVRPAEALARPAAAVLQSAAAAPKPAPASQALPPEPLSFEPPMALPPEGEPIDDLPEWLDEFDERRELQFAPEPKSEPKLTPESAVPSPPPASSGPRPEPEAAPAAKLQSAPAAVHRALSLDELCPAQWLELYPQLTIKGIVQTTAANCVLVDRQQNTLRFVLDQTKGSLYDASHAQRMADLLSVYFGQPIKVLIEAGNLPAGLETPAQADERIRREKHAAALLALKNDPLVQAMEREMGATLLEDTVTFS